MKDKKNGELHELEVTVDKFRREHDSEKLLAARNRHELEGLRDHVADLELDSQRPHMEDNEYTRNIRALENKLDKAMIKYNEAQSIRKTYEQIVRRLKEERVGFDNQLAAIERTLAAKQRDYEELLLLAGDANHARETALGELDRVRAGYEEERKRRERELRERHQVVQLRKQMLERMKQREKIRSQLVGAAEADHSNNAVNAINQNMMATEKLETRNKIDIFENAFRKIKEATGVSDVNEVIQKIVSQESTTENLISLTRENQSKMESLNDQRRKLKARVEEMKYASFGGGHRRKMVDDHEDQLANSSARLERARLKYERLSKVIIAMKAGVGHLQDKLEPVRDELAGKRVDLNDDTLPEVLRESEHLISNVLRRLKAGESELRRARMMGAGAVSSSQGQSLNSPIGAASFGASLNNSIDDAVNLSASRPFNQRIDLSVDDDAEDEYYADDAAVLADMDDDELTRDKVKRASVQILQNVERKRRKPKKKAGGMPGRLEAHDTMARRGPGSP